MPQHDDKKLDDLLDRAAVGGIPRVDLRHVGTIASMDLYVNVAGQSNPKEKLELVTALLFRAFIGRKRK